MHLQRRRLEPTNLDGVISASEHHRKKPTRSWSVDFGRAPSLSKWSVSRKLAAPPISRFTVDLTRVLILLYADEFRMPQMSIGSPFHKFEVGDQLGP
jgi:hypothetical protein